MQNGGLPSIGAGGATLGDGTMRGGVIPASGEGGVATGGGGGMSGGVGASGAVGASGGIGASGGVGVVGGEGGSGGIGISGAVGGVGGVGGGIMPVCASAIAGMAASVVISISLRMVVSLATDDCPLATPCTFMIAPGSHWFHRCGTGRASGGMA